LAVKLEKNLINFLRKNESWSKAEISSQLSFFAFLALISKALFSKTKFNFQFISDSPFTQNPQTN
jgi:hypothetical protein